ncbi:MAG: hypothetical protein N3A59_08770, partial [Thermodesulfovibrionales bacterium]|nr:hypothetical protein [Thermodesulfovibrionales bacterium]
MELWRRIIFYGCFVLVILLYQYAHLEPVILVEIFNLSEDKGSFTQRYAQSLLTEKEIQMIKNKRLADIKAKTIEINGSEWDEIYKKLLMLQNQRSLRAKNWDIPENWKKRLPSDQYPSKVFFFKTTETPVKSISNYLKYDNDQIYLYLTSLNAYLKVGYRIYS